MTKQETDQKGEAWFIASIVNLVAQDEKKNSRIQNINFCFVRTTFTKSKLNFPSFAMFERKKFVYIDLSQKNINRLMIFLQNSQAA